MYVDKYHIFAIAICIFVTSYCTATTHAQPTTGGEIINTDSRPWAKGVSPAAQGRALVLFQKGNEFLDTVSLAKAAAFYRQALKNWNHPAIQYNLMIAMINLDQPIAAYQAVIETLHYGGAPLEDVQYRQAIEYKKLLEKQIASLEVFCSQPGAIVKLDGKPILSGPGSVAQLVLAGEHEIVASKPNHLPITHTLHLAGGQKKRVELRLFTPDEVTVTRRNWASWQPWALVGGGAVLAFLGQALHWRAKVNIQAFDVALKEECPEGCYDSSPGSPYAHLQRGQLQQRIAVGTYIVGGALAVAGLLLAYRPHTTMISRDAESARITLMPSIASDNIGVSAAASF